MTATVKSKRPLLDLGLCRCCGASKTCRIINVEYLWCGQQEIYSDMFFDCFGLLLSELDGEPEERLICAMCVARLREAAAFKKQVLACEQKLLQKIIHVHNSDIERNNVENEMEGELEKHYTAVTEKCDDGNTYHDDEFSVENNNERKNVKIEIKEEFEDHYTAVTEERDDTLAIDIVRDNVKNEMKEELDEHNTAVTEECDDGNTYIDTKDSLETESDISKLKNEELEQACTTTLEYDVRQDYTAQDSGDSDDVPLKSEVKTTKRRETVKCPKKAKLKQFSKKKTKSDNSINSERELIKRISQNDIVTGNKMLCSRDNVKNDMEQANLDNEIKALWNTVTIVVNSYVCPFDSSFSDYFCIYCRDVFTEPDKLREHTLSHDPGTYKEAVLNKRLPQIDTYRIDCRLCLANIDDLELLKKHLEENHGKIFYQTSFDCLKFRLTQKSPTCTECGASFSFFNALKKHMAEHFGTCICDICGAHYFDERMLAVHQKSHQRVVENFACHCGKVFKSKHTRYLHETRVHKKEPTYQCSKCDEVLFSHSLRYRHMIEVHGENRVFPCESCDRSYTSRKALGDHTRRFHLKILKHQCDLCDKRFYVPARLREHMASHTGERNFKCEYCGKSYPILGSLKVHMLLHSSEKKFACKLCTASFTQNCNLKNHMKKHHQNS